jgi:hypothetical protein
MSEQNDQLCEWAGLRKLNHLRDLPTHPNITEFPWKMGHEEINSWALLQVLKKCMESTILVITHEDFGSHAWMVQGNLVVVRAKTFEEAAIDFALDCSRLEVRARAAQRKAKP